MLKLRSETKVMISDSDIDAALLFLNSLPYTITKKMPQPWAKQQLIDWVVKSMPRKIRVGDTFEVGTGVYAHIVNVNHGLLNPERDPRLLVILSIRSTTTDFSALNELKPK